MSNTHRLGSWMLRLIKGIRNSLIVSCLLVFVCRCRGFELSATALAFCGSAEIPCRWFLVLPPALGTFGCNTDRYLSSSLSSLRTSSSFRRSSCSKAMILESFIFSSLFFSCSACCSSRKLPILLPEFRWKHKQLKVDDDDRRLGVCMEASPEPPQSITTPVTNYTRTVSWVILTGLVGPNLGEARNEWDVGGTRGWNGSAPWLLTLLESKCAVRTIVHLFWWGAASLYPISFL